MNLVTGGAGFIGSHVAERLVRRGERVRVLDNFVTGKREYLNGLSGHLELIEGDICDLDTLRKAMKGVRVVYHQAALRSVPFSVDNPLASNEANVRGTLNVLVAARDAGVERVVYASSSSVYGDSPVLPKEESQACKPVSPYAVSKLAGENYCVVFTKIYGLQTVSLRYFNVFGPRQDPESQYAAVIPRFITWAFRDEPLQVHGDGLQSRDFTYIDDVVEANLLAARASDCGEGVFNIAQGKAHSLLDLIAILERLLGKRLKVVHTASRPGDVRRTLADISRARRYLGYEPGTDFETGLVKTVDYLRRHGL
ncbi:MAG TPA: SDR family oxidoreductase [candidate division Zixibacteria bacterium]|nr:SDR family oxidoreductase [candidate division Zixibacteria bacterium]